jgi:hypothetical protein
LWLHSAQIWVKILAFSIIEIALKAASGINNIEKFLAKIQHFRLFIA